MLKNKMIYNKTNSFEEVYIALKKDGIVYGERYTIQGLYEWINRKNIDKANFKLCNYSLCNNECYDDGYEKHLIPYPIENFEVKDIEIAVKKFIEKENSNDVETKTPEIYFTDVGEKDEENKNS